LIARRRAIKQVPTRGIERTMNVKRPTISPGIFWLASFLFFISGGTGLVYQVVWFKRFSHVWGSSSLAFAAVAGSFLFGLGVGAYLFGRFADRMTLPLHWYGVCELTIGGLALAIPREIAALADASAGLYAGIPEEPLLRFFIQFGITLVVLGPPCALMGGTLPLLIRQLTARDGTLDQATGWLYAINTLGAAAGCYLAGFHLLPSFGLLSTNNAAAIVNIVIGTVSVLVSRVAERPAPRKKAPPLAPDASKIAAGGWALGGVYVAAAMSGCAALVLEMTWARQLALVLGGSTYAFTATLAVVLVGIALGSLIFHLWLRRVDSSATLAVAVIGVLVAATLAGKLALPSLSLLVGQPDVRELRGDQFWNGVVSAGASAAIEFLPAVAMGLLFPLLVRMTNVGADHVGSAVGNIYAWNTLGSIAGASLTALLLFPRVGTAGAMALAAGLYVVALLLILPWRTALDFARSAGVAAAGAALVVLIARPIDPRLTNMGAYIYGDPALVYGDEDLESTITTLFFREGASSNVLVTTDHASAIRLRVNGKVDASNGTDMVTQLGLAYLPRIFKNDAKEVLVIGFGSGCTSGASLLFEGTHVTCCELEPAVYEAAPTFADYNHRPHEQSRAWLEARNAQLPPDERLSPAEIDAQARFSIIFGDGRTAIQGAAGKYDLVISEPSNPWLAGVSNLFTQEFFRAVREHLTDDGVLAQWIQTYSFTAADYAMIVRTVRSEFPHVGVLLLAQGNDTILLASKKPLLPDAKSVASLQAIVDGSVDIKADLAEWLETTDLRRLLALSYRVGQQQLEALVEREPGRMLNTDLDMKLEFDAPLHLFQTLLPRDSATQVLLAAVDEKWIAQLAMQVGAPRDSGEFHLILGDHYLQHISNLKTAAPAVREIELNKAAAEYEAAIAAEPKRAGAYRAMAHVRVKQNRLGDAAALFAQFVRLAPSEPLGHAELGLQFMRLKRYGESVKHLREALRLRPQVSSVRGTYAWANNLAWILATAPDDRVRNGPEAVEWAQRACQAEGYRNPSMLDTLAAALAEAGRFDEAIKMAERQIVVAVDNDELIEAARERIKLYRSGQPYRDE
jgi:predicted membrane-bound spermidine synthase/tetratricopeptide (TPR) repeat protein